MATQLTPLVLQPAFREGSSPLAMSGSVPNAGIYMEETTQRFVCGQRLITVDGRVFKYGKSITALLSGFGAANGGVFNIGAVIPAAAAAGDTKVYATIASNDGQASDGVIAKDELAGGYWVSGHGESKVSNRLILRNTAVASGGGTATVWLDGPLDEAMTVSSSYVEIVLNPYRYLSKGSLDYHGFMGVPAVNVTSGSYAWIQTWGPCWVTPGGNDSVPGNSACDRTVVFVGDGSVNGVTAITLENGYQVAGFIIDQTASGTGGLPLVMLQISI